MLGDLVNVGLGLQETIKAVIKDVGKVTLSMIVEEEKSLFTDSSKQLLKEISEK